MGSPITLQPNNHCNFELHQAHRNAPEPRNSNRLDWTRRRPDPTGSRRPPRGRTLAHRRPILTACRLSSRPRRGRLVIAAARVLAQRHRPYHPPRRPPQPAWSPAAPWMLPRFFFGYALPLLYLISRLDALHFNSQTGRSPPIMLCLVDNFMSLFMYKYNSSLVFI